MRRTLGIVAVLLVMGAWGLWQVDMVRQTVQIAFLSLTGGLWKIRGRLRTFMVLSPALGQKRQVIVYLPPGYDLGENRRRHYPVLYLLHGFPDPGDGWVRFGLAPQLVDKAIVDKELPPLVIVMPDAHGAIGQFGDGEYLNALTGNGRPGTRIEDYIARDIPRWVDDHFRTVASARGRFVGGESTGAYAAVNIGLKYPTVFGTMVSLSGYFDADLKHFGKTLWGPAPTTAQIDAESPVEYVRGPRPEWRDSFVYLGSGFSDYPGIPAQNDRLEARLTAAGVLHLHNRLPGHHSWDLWRLMLMDGLYAVKPRLEAASEPAPLRARP